MFPFVNGASEESNFQSSVDRSTSNYGGENSSSHEDGIVDIFDIVRISKSNPNNLNQIIAEYMGTTDQKVDILINSDNQETETIQEGLQESEEAQELPADLSSYEKGTAPLESEGDVIQPEPGLLDENKEETPTDALCGKGEETSSSDSTCEKEEEPISQDKESNGEEIPESVGSN